MNRTVLADFPKVTLASGIKAMAVVLIWAMVSVVFAGPASAAPGDVQLDWAQAAGGLANDSGSSIAVDAAGNTHITGTFSGTVDFDPSPAVFNLTSSNGSADAFVASYDPAGNLRSAFAIGGPGDDQGVSIAVDASGNTHITGAFRFTMDVDPGVTVFEITSSGGRDAFVAVYGPTGNLIWATDLGSSNSNESGGDIATDASGNTHLTGRFSGTIDFDPSPDVFELSSPNNFTDAFVAVYDPTGNLVWAANMGATGNDAGRGIATDAASNTHITGTFSGTVDFDPSPDVVNLTSGGTFVAVYDPTGNLVRAFAIRANSGEDIAVDAAGNTHLIGIFGGTADFDPGPGEVTQTTIAEDAAFVAVYDPAGTLIWVTTIGTSVFNRGWGIATDAAGNTYATGSFSNTTDVDPTAGVFELTSNGDTDAFVAVYSPTGNLLSAISLGSNDFDVGHGVATGPNGATHVTGSFTANVDFDPGPGEAVRAGGGASDFFVARYSLAAATPTSVCDGNPVTIDLNVTPGASGTAGDDVIFGTPGPDVINGLGGDDIICGEGGDDQIDGGDGLDRIFGGEGNDIMFGGEGNDRIRGNQGIDSIAGQNGNDFLYGGIDADTINGGEGNDTIGGFGGDDTINGGPGRDTIFGGFGADTITGGTDNDTINGLIGNDIITGGPGNDVLNGDQGQDTINGGDGNDLINGGNSIDTLFGDAGNDSVNGGKANDTLSGGPGTDTCTGNRGSDTADNTCEQIFGIP
jgi:Ca2+-binding RTX toxin-like protein